MYLSVNHTTLYYTQHGHGRPLILLHGNGSSHAIFADLVPQLASTHTVYALDSRDHGQSSTTDYISYQLMATDLTEFIHALQLVRPTIIGVGDGGISALTAIAQEPGLCSRLVLAGVNTRPRDLRWRVRIALAADYFSRPRKKLGLQMWGPHLTLNDLGHVQAATLVLTGGKDKVRLRATRRLTNALPHARMHVVPGATHDAYINDSNTFFQLINTFINAEQTA